MFIRKDFLLGLIFLFICSNSYSDNNPHLVPCRGTLADYDFSLDYHLLIRENLYSNLSLEHTFRMTVMPSFDPEWVIEIGKIDNKTTKVKYIAVEKQIYEQSQMNKSTKKLSIKRIQKES
jgi:hypothetical protein